MNENKPDWSLMGPTDFSLQLHMDEDGKLGPKKEIKKAKGVKTWKPKIVQRKGIIR